MKNAMKKLLSLTLAVMLLLSVAPFQAFAATNAYGEMVFSEEFEAPATNNNTSTSQTAEEPKPVVDNDAGISTFALPDGCKLGDAVNIYFNVDGSIMKTVSKKVGDDFPGLPSGKDALAFYAKVNENSNGKAFKCWSFEEDGAAISASGLKVGGSEHLTEDYDHLDSKGNPVSPDAKGNTVYKMEVYAVFEDVVSTTNVKLDPKSGKFAPGDSDTIAVSLNADYPVADFPTPTRSGYVFDGWYVQEDASRSERRLVDGEGNPGADLTVLSTSAKPYAKWKKTGMTVSVMWYGDFENGGSDDWIDFTVNGVAKYTSMPVPADSKLSASTGSFPTDSEINWQELPDGYTLKGWKFLETGKEFKAGSTAITSANANSSNEVVIVPKLQRSVWLIAQHPTKNTLAKQSITVEIGSRIGELPAPASWAEDSDETDGYTFTQWVADDTVISTREDLKNTSKHPVYYPSLNSNDDHSSRYEYHFDAQWEVAKVVQLYFHVDGKTSTYAKKVSCYDIPASGSFNMHSLNLYKYFPDYSKYDDGVDVAYGWYTDAQWKNYCTGKPAATVCDELWNVSDTKDLQELHIMLIDKGTDSNKYNNNNKTADKTNPKTGDIIMAAVAILVVSGAALAGIYYLTKRKRGTK